MVTQAPRARRSALPTDTPSNIPPLSYYCCGVRIDAYNMADAASRIVGAARARTPLSVHLCNAYTLALARKNIEFGHGLNEDDINLPDGMPLAWLARSLGLTKAAERIYGPTLMLRVLDIGRAYGLRHFFYGSTAEVLSLLKSGLESRFPGIEVVGTESPPFRALSDNEIDAGLARIRASNADVVWIGLGTPKQDDFVHRYAVDIGRPAVAVGAAFAFVAGTVPQAPALVQRIGLEWAYRLMREPRRLWRRYLFGNFSFVQGVVVGGTVVESRQSPPPDKQAHTPRVAVLVATFERRTQTLRCLETLEGQQSNAAVRLIVLDDKSSDGTAEAVQARYPAATVIAGSGDLFWAGGMRRAFHSACAERFDYVLWLNDDVLLDPTALANLLATEKSLHARHGPVIVVGAVEDPGTGLASYSGVRRHPLRRTSFSRIEPGQFPRRAETMNGNAVLVSVDVLERLGHLDQGYRHGIADYDYGLRATAAGIGVWIAPGFVGRCERNTRRVAPTAKARWASMRSPKGIPPTDWLLFTRRHAGPAWPLFWLSPYIRHWLREPRTRWEQSLRIAPDRAKALRTETYEK